MSPSEPRLNPGNGGAPASAAGARASGSNGANGASGANGHGTATVGVGAGVENALAAVQQQLARQAATVAPPRIVTVATIAPPLPAPPPPVVEPAPPPPPPPRPRPAATPVVVAPVFDEDDDSYWEELPEAQPTRIDPSLLTRQERRALGKLRARKVRRIVRHVSPWSVFKTSLLLYLCVGLILMVAGVLLWHVSRDAGVITNVEKFYAKASGEKIFEVDGRKVFRAAATAGAIFVFAATALTVLFAVLFNLITDLTGGVRITVLELENTRRVLRRGASKSKLRATAGVADPEPESSSGSGAERDTETDAESIEPASAPAAEKRPRAGAATSSETGDPPVPEPRARQPRDPKVGSLPAETTK